ncbi:hypothetical protein [Nonomuraea dietziae]|uniref:hypothetical protein n=1 Tax=Nonomuraea dietziae TaxID=65515 RepID=UPI003421FA3C
MSIADVSIAEEPHWADSLSAWSTLAAAVLALFAAGGAVFAAIIAWRTFKSQSAVFAEQIKQLQEDRERREQDDREREEERQKRRLAEARKVSVKAGSFRQMGTSQLLQMVSKAEEWSGISVYDFAVLRVLNNSAYPIRIVQTDLDGAEARHVWIDGDGPLSPYPQLDFISSGATAFFVHQSMAEDEIGSVRVAVTFTDEDGQVWEVDRQGRAELQHASASMRSGRARIGKWDGTAVP